MEENVFCSLCYEPITIKEEVISFSCKHNVCFQCFPFLLINLITSSNQKIDWKILKSFKNLHQCPLCSEGSSIIPIKDISEYFSKYFTNNNENDLTQQYKKSILCKLCFEKQATKYCSSCDSKAMNSVLCDECMEQLHTISKFKPHKIVSLENAPENIIRKNNANANYLNFIHKPALENGCCYKKNKKIECFCMSCSSALCEECSDKYHVNHNIIDIKLFQEKFDEFPQLAIKDWIGTITSYFNLVKSAVLTQAKKELANISQSFDIQIDNLIIMLQNMKKESQDFLSYKSTVIENKMDLIKSSIQIFSQKIDQSQLTNNQKFQMMKNFSIKKNPLLGIDHKSFKCQDIFEENFFSKEDLPTYFKKNLSNFNKKKIDEFFQAAVLLESFLIEEKTDSVIEFNKKQNFIGNPIEILDSMRVELEEETFFFAPYFLKSSCSCTFMINNETFLAWAGYSTFLYFMSRYPLVVYNLTRREVTSTLNYFGVNHISVIGTFPKDGLTESKNPKKWLYTGDSEGALLIYDQITLLELYSIRSKDKAILSAIIFEDKFKEVYKNDIYALISFDGAANILMYRFIDQTAAAGKWEMLREFQDTYSKLCTTINYFHDDSLYRTNIFFGFERNFILMFNFNENRWENRRFPTINKVTSINFLVRLKFNSKLNKFRQKREATAMEKFIIFTQKECNLVIVGDIDEGTIVKQIAIPNIISNLDACIWNSIPISEMTTNSNDKKCYLLVTSIGNEQNAINIIDFEDFSLVSSKKFKSEENPINILKTKIWVNQNYKEVIVQFNKNHDEGKVYLYSGN